MGSCPQCGAEVPANASFCPACGEDLHPAVADSAVAQSDVKKCYFCSKPFVGEDAYYFKCRYCEHDFCSEHRLPENHLCKSSPLRRNIPTTSMPYYSTSSGYYTSSGQSSRGGLSLSLSKQGRNLIILIASGVVIGLLASFIFVDNIQVLLFLLQDNYLVYHGWLPALVTSIIVVAPNILGLEDIFFNAIAVFFIDGLLRNVYSPKQYYVVFLLTAIAGNVVSLFGYGPGGGIVATTLSFGASGGIFGLVAGAVSADYAFNRRVNTALVIWFLIIFVWSALGGSVDIFAHLGGALVGLAMGFVIGERRRTSYRHSR